MNDLHRMIDANTNRASEGLRFLEDTARFSLNDHALSTQLKSLRHTLQTAVSLLGITQLELLNARDTPNDVGTGITGPNELSRPEGIAGLITAAAKRSQEAMRVLEESCKALGHESSPFESIRYGIYDAHRELMLKVAKPAARWSVCVLVTRSLCVEHSPEHIIRESARAGAGCVQIREKDVDAQELLSYSTQMTKVAHDSGIACIINDRVDIAASCGADGVHLGQTDLPIHDARAILGPTRLIGRSCSSVGQLTDAFMQGADYCGLGPVFSSTTKAKPNLCGIDMLSAAMSATDLSTKPMLAISGITPTNTEQIAMTGFPGVAVSSAICSASDPFSVCSSIVEIMRTSAGSC
ncbi:MAG: thiamine phosphate synthase [Phycisphaerales bacterium]